MRIRDYDHQAGRHADSTSARNLLAHAGVVAPHTGEPPSEACVLGIAGGIGGGYSYCPSIPRDGLGSGVAVIGRALMASFDGAFHRNVFDRLGVETSVAESSSPAAASKKLVAELESGRPVLVWTGKNLPYLDGDPDTCAGGLFAWSIVVHGLDEERGEALVGDLAPGSLSLDLDALAAARGAICTHKNRQLSIVKARKLSASALKKAMVDGLKDCIDGQRRPRIKTFSLQGLIEWSKVIASPGNKNGWPRAFPRGRMYWPLRDVFRTVDVRDGEGLLRPMFADFLSEAAEVTGKTRYAECAETYRGLAARWTRLAERALPDRCQPFKKLKGLYREHLRLFVEEGAEGLARMAETADEIRRLEQDVMADFPLDEGEVLGLLEEVREDVLELHARETEALEELAGAVG